MKHSAIVSFVFLLAYFHTTYASQALPDKFYGTFKLEKSENFEEYLVAKGYGWLMRKMIMFASITKVFERGTTPGTFRFKTLTSKKDVEADSIVFGKSFQSEGLDSHQHHVLFSYNPSTGVVTESRRKLGDPEKNTDVYHYHIDGDFLVLNMTWNNVLCKHFYRHVRSI